MLTEASSILKLCKVNSFDSGIEFFMEPFLGSVQSLHHLSSLKNKLLAMNTFTEAICDLQKLGYSGVYYRIKDMVVMREGGNKTSRKFKTF